MLPLRLFTISKKLASWSSESLPKVSTMYESVASVKITNINKENAGNCVNTFVKKQKQQQ